MIDGIDKVLGIVHGHSTTPVTEHVIKPSELLVRIT
jgi:hypothetical protein